MTRSYAHIKQLMRTFKFVVRITIKIIEKKILKENESNFSVQWYNFRVYVLTENFSEINE